MLLGLASGCYEGFDPLDPAVLTEVMRTRGNAVGDGHTGIYLGTVETLECGCPPVDPRAGLEYDATLCGVIEYAEDFGLEDAIAIELVQGDGSVRIRAVGAESPDDVTVLLPTLYGPLYTDGRVFAGGILEVDALLVQGAARARVDGTLVGDPEAGRLELEYRQINQVELLGNALDGAVDGFGVEDEVLQTLDCRERIRLSMAWVDAGDPTR